MFVNVARGQRDSLLDAGIIVGFKKQTVGRKEEFATDECSSPVASGKRVVSDKTCSVQSG